MKDDIFNTEIAIECIAKGFSWVEHRFPTDAICCCCPIQPLLTLDRNDFGGRSGGYAMELVTLIRWALAEKYEYTFEELEVNESVT